jgi:hypothetical protein
MALENLHHQKYFLFCRIKNNFLGLYFYARAKIGFDIKMRLSEGYFLHRAETEFLLFALGKI